ncbi:MAG: hypothetical protein D3905_01780 [Candidatus Electrothrix sp. AS4_5]|nr:hypothetical protein [Candidatus Electrothrix gigas]MCI5188529.1 hypothetical protein [Candidatus Electrothrix gigas]
MDRGLLDLSVQLSTRNITAGNEFALFVLATNPFDKPVWIREVNVSLPSELKLAHERKAQEKIKEEQERRAASSKAAEQRLTEIRTELDRLLQRLETIANKQDSEKHDNELAELYKSIKEEAENICGQGVSTIGVYDGAEIGTLKVGSNITTVGIYGGKREGISTRVGKVEVYDSEIAEGLAQARTVKLKSSLPDGVALQPGSTVVYTVVLNVKKSLIFTPTAYRLQFNVNYGFTPETPRTFEEATQKEDEVLTNTIAHELAIRPSVYSLIIGAMLGGFIGSSAKLLQTTPSEVNLISSFVTIAVAVILSGMAIIFMARKSDAQSFVSIEDFWGGLLIGFLVGYTGTSFFESLTGVATSIK